MKLRTVYFMRQKGIERGPIKIGCSSYLPKRLDNLSVWSPVPLEVVASFAGGFHEERRLHSAFWSDHSHHEWFRWSPRLANLIASVVRGEFDISSLPEPAKISRGTKGRKWSAEQRARTYLENAVKAITKQTGLHLPFGTYAFNATSKSDMSKRAAVIAFLADPTSNGISHEEWQMRRDQSWADHHLDRAEQLRKQAEAIAAKAAATRPTPEAERAVAAA